MSERPPRAELFVRSLAPTDARDQQEQVVERLRTLDAEGRVSTLDVRLCGECVCPESVTAETEPGRRLLDRYEAFRQWADERGRELVGFEERDTKSLLTGSRVTGIVFPRIVLAEYRDGDLTHVTPSRNGTERTSVSDRLDAL
ncbi:HTH domain-containing protein [Halorientalis litorea]|uniref:HTH domain-containing protein n=1 Tax=Halorientalis litorea TaxID=2931977 RepID=UPI001FF4D541|nr:HTH domain-containing protein [Halorientalis litorea]